MTRLLLGSLLALACLAARAEAQYQLVWSDDFDGSSLDLTKWTPVTGTGCPSLCGWGNNEEQYYRSENATVANGFLTIQARQEFFGGQPYTSARLHSENKGDFLYGRFEMRAKLPTGQGIWPAFWLFPTDEVYGVWAASGEIDIMELVGNEPNRVHGTTHFGNTFPGNVQSGSSYTLPSGTFNDEFHVFAVEWEETEIRWYVDGIHYRTQTSWWSGAAPYPAPFDERFHVILNCAVGGNWPGSPNGSTQFPQDFVIDYVRVYQESTPADSDCRLLFDDMEHGNPYGNGYFTFSGGGAGGNINANFAQLPPSEGGSASLEAGWGAGGATGFYGGFGRTKVLDLTDATHFEMWIQPDAGQEYVIEVNLQDDDNGDAFIPGTPDGADDEFQYELTVGPPGSGAEVVAGGGWQRVSIPLSSFTDDNSFHFGGNGVLDPFPGSQGGNGPLVNVVLAMVSTSGSDTTFRTDLWEFTRSASGVSGHVWNDADLDGVLEAGEAPFANVGVELLDATSGAVLATDVTAADGSYAFTGLFEGAYTVRVDASALPASSTPTVDPDGTETPHELGVVLGCDEVLADQDFGYREGPLLQGSPAFVTNSLGGTQALTLTAPDAAGSIYLLFGSVTGTEPGLPLGGDVVVPLNFDAYTLYTVGNPNAPPLGNSVGALDGSGAGAATFSLGQGQVPNGLFGVPLHHAYVTFALDGSGITGASNAVPVFLLP